MINLGEKEIYTKPNGWTICTKDGKPSAHFEHTIVITEQGGNILSNGTLPGK
jgi:methionyl aminopeptidase